jgi:hypothetical protein
MILLRSQFLNRRELYALRVKNLLQRIDGLKRTKPYDAI